MKFKILLFIFFLSSLTGFAQKQTCFLFAYTQKIENAVCGSKLLIAEQELSLADEQIVTYKTAYKADAAKKYNYENGYRNTYVELVKPNQVVIMYEAQKPHSKNVDGVDCTTTYYGCVTARDFVTAESRFAALQNEFKTSVFKEIKRWGKAQIASIKPEDVEVKWVQTKQGIVGFFTNTRKDMAFNVEIKAVKKSTGTQQPNAIAEMTVVEKHNLTVQPGEKVTLNFKMADGFNIDVWPVPATEEKEGLIEKGKHLIKQYLTDPNKKIKPAAVAFGVRG